MDSAKLKDLITGKDLSALVNIPVENKLLHGDVLADFLQFRELAAGEGIAIKLTSSHRDFQRQLTIWNEKVQGLRPVLDSSGVAMDISKLSELDLMRAILRWNALPGTSRHHWGTDFDVYDEAARPTDYQVQLIPQEIEAGGVFERLGAWLEDYFSAAEEVAFFRPYRLDLKGVAPEWWHISHRQTSGVIEKALDIEMVAQIVSESPMELKETVLENLEFIMKQYVFNISRS